MKEKSWEEIAKTCHVLSTFLRYFCVYKCCPLSNLKIVASVTYKNNSFCTRDLLHKICVNNKHELI